MKIRKISGIFFLQVMHLIETNHMFTFSAVFLKANIEKSVFVYISRSKVEITKILDVKYRCFLLKLVPYIQITWSLVSGTIVTVNHKIYISFDNIFPLMSVEIGKYTKKTNCWMLVGVEKGR